MHLLNNLCVPIGDSGLISTITNKKKISKLVIEKLTRCEFFMPILCHEPIGISFWEYCSTLVRCYLKLYIQSSRGYHKAFQSSSGSQKVETLRLKLSQMWFHGIPKRTFRVQPLNSWDISSFYNQMLDSQLLLVIRH